MRLKEMSDAGILVGVDARVLPDYPFSRFVTNSTKPMAVNKTK